MDTETPSQEPETVPETLGNTSVFPPPPSVYRHFTLANAAWLDLLQSCKANDATLLADAQASEEARIAEQTKALTMAKGALPYAPPTIDLERTLSPPKVEWIEEDGGYQLFGQRWPIPDTAPSLEQLDHRHVLQQLLRTLLQTYFELTCDLLRPIQPYDVWVPAPHSEGGTEDAAPPNGTWISSSRLKDRLQHMETVVINFLYLLNQLRPTQSRAALATMMRTQVQRKREAAAQLRAKCEAIRTELASLEM
ncbi:RNA polymerase II transcription regulator [Malassezia pachydermatis]